MPQQEYIKHLHGKEDFSINKIGMPVSINWRTTANMPETMTGIKMVSPGRDS